MLDGRRSGRDHGCRRLRRGDGVRTTTRGPSAAEVLVDGERFAVIKPSRDAERQFADERIPDWLEAAEPNR